MSNICTVDECHDYVLARGYCRKHYGRWRDHGNPLGGRTFNGAGVEWLRNNVVHTSLNDSCVVWPFPVDELGYGTVSVNGSSWGAHAYAASILAGNEGVRPDHMIGRHLCTNPSCVVHVCWGTKEENQHDRWRDGTDNRGERHPRHRLTEDDVRKIKNLLTKGETCISIGNKFGVHRRTITDIKLDKTWQWLTTGES